MAQSVDYSFSMTLKPKLYCLDATEQYDKIYDYVTQKLKSFGKVSCIVECTKSYNIHLHGIVTFDMKPAKCIKLFQKLFIDSFRDDKCIGFIVIKQITDFAGWLEYISKDLEVTKDLIHRPPILIDQYELFTEVKYLSMYHQQ